jgi:sugar phosphate isomerase/epimerase
VARSGTDYRDLVSVLNPGNLFVVELDDALKRVHGTLWEDTVNHRKYCGEGELDVVGFIEAIKLTGFDSYWGVEILSAEHRELPLEIGLRRAFDSTQEQFRLVCR